MVLTKHQFLLYGCQIQNVSGVLILFFDFYIFKFYKSQFTEKVSKTCSTIFFGNPPVMNLHANFANLLLTHKLTKRATDFLGAHYYSNSTDRDVSYIKNLVSEQEIFIISLLLILFKENCLCSNIWKN